MLTLTANTVSAFAARLLDRTPATVTATVEDSGRYTYITPATHADAIAIADVVEDMYNRYWIIGEVDGSLTYTVPTPDSGKWGVAIVWR